MRRPPVGRASSTAGPTPERCSPRSPRTGARARVTHRARAVGAMSARRLADRRGATLGGPRRSSHIGVRPSLCASCHAPFVRSHADWGFSCLRVFGSARIRGGKSDRCSPHLLPLVVLAITGSKELHVRRRARQALGRRSLFFVSETGGMSRALGRARFPRLITANPTGERRARRCLPDGPASMASK